MIRIPLSLIILLGIVPQFAFAQLSSTNYQVDVQYVGEEGGGTATSTNYQFDGSSGSPFDYDPQAPAAPGEESGGATYGSRPQDDGSVPVFSPDGSWAPGQGGVSGGGNGAPGGTGGSEGESGFGSVPPSYEGGSNDGSTPSSPEKDSPVGEGMTSSDAVSLIAHVWGMFLEHPYLYTLILLGILLLTLFLLHSIRSEE